MVGIFRVLPPAVLERRQIVDIEFVSGSDAVDRHDPLPGTEVKAQQRKVSSNALVSNHGTTFSPARVPAIARVATTPVPANVTRRPSPLTEKHTPRVVAAKKSAPSPSKEQAESAGDMFIQKPLQPTLLASAVPSTSFASQFPTGSKWVTKTIAPIKHSDRSSTHANAALEEVAPPELVELTDTQGESHATEAFQNGGHSTGGKGAPSPLSVYLKELHKRIKHAWSPPKGETRTAEILFRIKKSGQLESIKLLRRSGNEESDEAAIAAIASCSPFKPLPDVITNDYLDLEYTFNYTADNLSELPGHQTQ
jgi:TonB family protein